MFGEDEKATEAVATRETRKRKSILGRALSEMSFEKPPEVSFSQLLKLNKPDWVLVLIGVLFSALIGCLFPIVSLLFSEVLRVSL